MIFSGSRDCFDFVDTLYWSELHPHENGRTIVFSKSANNITGEAQRWTPDEYSAHTTVHEYGGGSVFVCNGSVFFMNHKVSFVPFEHFCFDNVTTHVYPLQ